MTGLIIEEGKPSTFVVDEVKSIRQFAKNPKRAITRVKGNERSGPVRPLGYGEIAVREKGMIQSGQNINPKFSKEGRMKINEMVENRIVKLYEVIKECVEAKGYFSNNMLREDAILHDRITLSKAYLKGSIAADLKKLVRRGLIYRRGGHRFMYYYLGPSPVDEEKKDAEAKKDKEVEQSSEEAKGMIARLREEIGEAMKRVTGEKSLIPERITIDVNVKFSW